MRKGRTFGDREQAVAAFVASELGCEATRVVRVAAFATNAVYEVDADGRRFVVKASRMHDAVRAEAWACARGADAGCATPAILGLGRLGTDDSMSAFIMRRVQRWSRDPLHQWLVKLTGFPQVKRCFLHGPSIAPTMITPHSPHQVPIP